MAVREMGKVISREIHLRKTRKKDKIDERKSALYFTKILLFVDT